MSFRTAIVVTLISMNALSVSSACAGELSGELTLTSDYIFRGVTQTDEDPAIQGGVEYAWDSGLYAGIWGSSISWLADSDPDVSSQLELSGTVGFRGDFGIRELGYDIAATYYWYPGSYPSGFNSPNTVELSAGLSYRMLSATFYYAPTDLFGTEDSKGSRALEAGLDWEFQPTWSLVAQLGRQWVAHHSEDDYTYWKIGGTKRLPADFVIEAAYHDANLDDVDSTVTLSITKMF